MRRAPVLLLAALATLSVLGSSAAAQTLPRDAPELARHLRAVRAEREARLLAAWDAAEAERRAAALEGLRERTRTGAPAGAPLPLELVDEAVRRLGGPPPGDPTLARARRAADALDLMPVPGLVSPGRGPGGDGRVTVRVHPLYRVGLEEPVHLLLHWIAPDGGEVRARRERVAAEAFGRPGFDLFVRVPRDAEGAPRPGRWRLVPELELEDGTRVRGVSVPLEVLAEGDASAEEDRLRAHGPAALEAARALRESGARSALATGLLEEGALPRRAEEGPPRWILPASGGGGPVWVLFVPRSTDPAAPLVPGSPWRAAARAAGADLVAAEPAARPGALVAALGAEGRPVVAFAWGEAVTRLAFLRVTGAAPVPDGWVVLEDVPGTFDAGEVPLLRLREGDTPQALAVRDLPGRAAAWSRERWGGSGAETPGSR